MSTRIEEPLRARTPRRGWLYLVPVLLFAAVGVFLALGLGRDPHTLPSVLIDKPAPAFALPPLPGRDERGFSSADLGGRPMLVNVFASWCVPCRIEHPVLDQLAREGVTVHAINYKDAPEDALTFLRALGDPFARIGADRQGRAAIDWGVYGVPETFVIDRDGRIRYRHVGPLQPRDLERTIRPLLAELGR
jgi:cytochrome c biogenesis protein CcmG/thiol:disulfide interchange protein DsbE